MADESSLALPEEAATQRLGAALSVGVAPGRTLYLSGELGSGKTTLVRGLLRALGYAGRVKSPSYPLVELYVLSSLNFYHFDFYRIRNQAEWQDSGFREYFNAQSACVVEWPERLGGLLPPPTLAILLEIAGNGRRATLSAGTAEGQAWRAQALARYSSSA
jgi:tRNA threonylcarbamoyladenosine biosynthesis protein TsaE